MRFPAPMNRRACCLLVALVGLVAPVATGCESGEGDPCQLDFDCAAGLVCSGEPRGMCIDPADQTDDENDDSQDVGADAGMSGDDDAGT